MTNNPYQLFHEGAQALARATAYGLRVDTNYCRRAERKITRQIKLLEEQFSETDIARAWKKKKKPNYDSNPQLAEILFKDLGYKSTKETSKGNKAVDEEALKALNIPEVDILLRIRKLKKLKSTYLGAFIRETVDGFIHANYPLNLVSSFRGSSDRPNLTNVPTRDKEALKICRQAIVPRPRRRLVVIDYSAMEVKIIGCVSKDKNLIKYIKTPGSDPHRDIAAEIFKTEDVTKELRYAGKNGFNFPTFYGDFYKHTAEMLWKTAQIEKVKIPGIKTYNQFERHIEQVEYRFKNEKFPGHTKWAKAHIAKYEQTGHIDLITGFRCSGVMTKNQLLNLPIQGPAFHCLLWSLIQLDKWLRRKRMKTVICGHIHDAIIFDMDQGELWAVVEKTKQVMCQDIREHWPWIIVPLAVEGEWSAVDGNWAEMETMPEEAAF